MLNCERSVIKEYSWYENDILGQAIEIFKRTGRIHSEILESALGIGKKLSDGNIEDAKMLGVQLRVVLLHMHNSEYSQPPDAGQLLVMMCSDDYPLDVREKIATSALGAHSLDELIDNTRRYIPGFEQIR